MKIVFLEPLGLKVEQIEAACEGLKKVGHEVIIYPDRNENLDELKRRAARCARTSWTLAPT